MNWCRRRVTFKAEERMNALLAARKFVNDLPGHVEIERRESVAVSGAIFVDVVADEDTVALALPAAPLVTMQQDVLVATSAPDECVNCGNISDDAWTVCPCCGFREISPCPKCGREIPRQSYESAEGSLHKCPECTSRVRMKFAEPLYEADGHYRQPLVNVSKA